MANVTVMRALMRKHAALVKLAEIAEATAAARRQEVEHVAETIRLLQLDTPLSFSTKKFRRRIPITRTLLTVLRRARKPLELMDLMAGYASEANDDVVLHDPTSRSRLEMAVKTALGTLRNRGLVHQVRDSAVTWEISAACQGTGAVAEDDSCSSPRG